MLIIIIVFRYKEHDQDEGSMIMVYQTLTLRNMRNVSRINRLKYFWVNFFQNPLQGKGILCQNSMYYQQLQFLW